MHGSQDHESSDFPDGMADPYGQRDRNYVNVLTSDIVIALPGSRGTLDEIRLAVRFAKPLICVGPQGAFEGVPDDTRIVSELKEVFAFIEDMTAMAR